MLSAGDGLAWETAPFRVGEWTAEPTLNQLSSAGTTVKVEPKAMAVLCCLARSPGQVVYREALLSTVWAGVVVSDDALTQVVVKLRRALRDLAEEPAYIQTIQKGGYRLIAPVVREATDPSLRPSPGSSLAVANRLARSMWLGSLTAVVLLGVSVALWMRDRPVAVPAPASEASGSATPAGRPTVGVQPFAALGNDPQEVLLARGIGADLVSDLSKLSGLWIVRVAPGDGRTPVDLAREAPSIQYLVSGTVQRTGDRIRLHVGLADAQTGKQLWSERFDRTLSGLFEIQDEVGRKILETLPLKLSEEEVRRVAQRHTRNLEAYETFQRGRAALYVRRKAENEAARESFRRAIVMDPAFARAYAALAMTHTADYRNQWVPDGAAALDRALELARTALRINPDIPEPYWVLAFVHSHRREHDRALEYLQTAVRLFPSFAEGHALMGGVYTSIGRPADGVARLQMAMRLDPASGYPYFTLLGRAYLFLGDLEQARIHLEHGLSRNPEFLDAHVYLAAVHLQAGERDAAQWEAEVIRTLRPDFNVERWLETNPTADPELRSKLVHVLRALGF